MHLAPTDIAWLLNLNPMTHIMRSYQQVLFFDGPLGHQKALALVGVLSIGVFLVGYFVFDRLRDSFAEEVDDARHRRHQRLEGLPPLRAEEAVRDAEVGDPRAAACWAI